MKHLTDTVSRMVTAGAVALLISGCGGGGDGDAESDTIVLPGLAVSGLGGEPADMLFNPWLVSINTFRLESETPGTGDARIETLQYSDNRTIQDHIDFYSGGLVVDTCEVITDDDGGGGGGSGNIPYVDGGNAVVINAPGGIWYTLGQGDSGIYEVDNELPGAFPSGATVSVPGGVFPSVSAIPVSEPAPPVRILPAAGQVSVDSEYQWQAVGGSGVTMRIAFLEYDSAGNFIDFRILCDADDDGAFALPADILNEIETNPNTLVARFARVKRTIELIEGVAVYSRIVVAE